MNVAEVFVKALSDLGVKRIYGVIGTSLIDFIDALYDCKEIRYISCRHEQVSASMADAEGRITGFPGVAIAHGSPGVLNSAISIANAYKDGSPMVLISGCVSRALKGKNPMLEANQFEMMRQITAKSFMVEEARDVSRTIYEAFSVAINKSSPVYVEIPEDVWSEESEYENIGLSISRREAHGDLVSKALEIIESSKKPLILAGYGVNSEEGSKALKKLVEKTGIPVVTTGNGRGAMDENHELCFGRTGFGGGSIHADRALKNSDCVICLGCQLSDVTTYGFTWLPSGKVIAVTLDEEAKKKFPYDLFVHTDAVDFTKKLSEETSHEVDKSWVEEIRTWQKEWNEMLDRFTAIDHGLTNPSLFFRKLNEKIQDYVICAGQGMHVLYVNAYLKIRSPRSYLATTNHGAMGFGFPAGIAAALLGKKSIAVVGDGEFMMTIQDLETAVRERIPVKVIVVNDNSYRVLYFRQKFQKGGRVYGTLHSNPDFAKLAEVFGAEGIAVEKNSEIEEGIKVMLESDKPFVLDLRISPESFAPFNFEAIR
ncbi:MAG: thiamine pyrophosphate-binding protein [Archaeoglobaceae archaeon]